MLSAHVARVDTTVLARFPTIFGATPAEQTTSLAQALATSPSWRGPSSRACLAVRAEPIPTFAVVGRLAAGDQPLIDALHWQVQDSLRRLRPIPYREVEELCARLADELVARLGAQRLQAMHLVAVPRGGLVVAGLLSYALRLSHDQVRHPPSDDQELLVVDDCVLSGLRTRRWLSRHTGPPVVLAHLHSHPDLRQAVERHPAVRACVAAADLHDHAPGIQGSRYAQWRQEWAKRSPEDFWTGHPDHVVYPWNEPDSLIWNGVLATGQPGWHVVPPSWCLKNRVEGSAVAVQVCASPHVPADVLWAAVDDSVVLVHAGSGTCLELRGTGVDFWRALLQAGEVAAAAEALSQRFDASPDVVRADLELFTASLRDGGWWAPARAPGSP